MRRVLTIAAVLATAGLAQAADRGARVRDQALARQSAPSTMRLGTVPPQRSFGKSGPASQHPFSKPFSKGPPSWR